MSWETQTVGTWELTQFENPGTNGRCHTLGEFASYRAAVEAARRIVKHSKLQGGFTTSFKRSDKREGAGVDGFTRPISLAGPEVHDADVELKLIDGRVVWLSDLETELFDLRCELEGRAVVVPTPPRTVGGLLDCTASELESIHERVEELMDWADEEGYRAITHKLQEAMGPLNAASEATRQYASGQLTAKN